MLVMLQIFADNPPNSEDQPPTPPPSPVANVAVQQDVQLEILRILQEMHLNYAVDCGGGNGGGDRDGRGKGNHSRN